MLLSMVVLLVPDGSQLSTFCAVLSCAAFLLMCKRGKNAKPNAPVKGSADVLPADTSKDAAKPKSEKNDEPNKAEVKKSSKEKSKLSKSKKEVKEPSKKSEKKEKSVKEGSKKETEKKDDDKKEASEKKDAKELSAKKDDNKDKSKKEASKQSEIKADAKEDKKLDDPKEASNLLDAEKKSAKKDDNKEDDKNDGSKKESSKKDAEKKDDNDEPKEGSKMEVQKTQMTVIPAALPKELSIDPKELRFTSAGGLVKLNLTNSTGVRVAIKVKCSDNDLFRINPVFTLIEKDAKFTVEVSRDKGTVKPDKLAIVHTEVADDVKDAQAVYKANPAADKLTTTNVPIYVS